MPVSLKNVLEKAVKIFLKILILLNLDPKTHLSHGLHDEIAQVN